MNFNTKDWKSFYLKDLYEIKMGNGFDKNKMSDDNPSVNFVSRVSYNNGVDIQVDKVKGVEPYSAGLLTVALGGSYLGSCFVQEAPFYTAQNVAVMTPVSEKMSHEINLFISTLVRFESKIKYYAFGRELNAYINQNFSINLPVMHNADKTHFIDKTHKYSKKGYVPDWEFMENYIKSLHSKPLTTKNKNKKIPALNINKWKEFTVSSILSIKNGKGITKEEIEENPGDFVAVQSGEENNGVLGLIDKDYCKNQKYTMYEKPCLTVARSGSAGFVSFQYDGCVVGDSAKILYLDDSVASKEVYLFIQTILTANRFKYAYGRKVTEDNYMADTIKLPIQYQNGKPLINKKLGYTKEGYVPDWEFMENYIKALPYGDRI